MNRSAFSRPIFWPLVLIAAGVLWLLANFGMIESGNLGILLRLWPVLLIGLGLDILIRRRWPAISNLIALALVTFGVLAVIFAPRLGYTGGVSGWFYMLPWVGEAGSGKVITETRAVSDFNAISFDALGELTVTPGEQESLRVEGEDNVLRRIRTEVRDGVLYIGSTAPGGWFPVQPTRPIRFTLTVTRLNGLDLNGVGNAIVEDLESDELQTTLQGAGSLTLVDASLDAFSLRLSGAGSVTASGQARHVDTILTGVGSYHGGELQSETARVTVTGLGSASVWATEHLNAEITGLGTVRYFGDPAVDQSVTGLGSVQAMGER
jgi:hypothetical protein